MPNYNNEKELQRLLNELKEQVGSFAESHMILHSSLLGLNGLLISAFAIIVSINPNKYDCYILLYLTSLFLAVTVILTNLLLISRVRYRACQQTLYQALELTPESKMDKIKNKLKKKIRNKPQKDYRENMGRQFLDYFSILMSFINTIILFIIIYNT